MNELPDPGPGWRWLEPGDVIEEHDETFDEGKSRQVVKDCIGVVVVIPKAFRRRIITTKELLDGATGKQPDPVNAPPHYRQGEIECIDAIQSALTDEEFRGFIKGNAIKYCWREKHKGGDQDLAKAKWYLDRLSKEQP